MENVDEEFLIASQNCRKLVTPFKFTSLEDGNSSVEDNILIIINTCICIASSAKVYFAPNVMQPWNESQVAVVISSFGGLKAFRCFFFFLLKKKRIEEKKKKGNVPHVHMKCTRETTDII